MESGKKAMIIKWNSSRNERGVIPLFSGRKTAQRAPGSRFKRIYVLLGTFWKSFDHISGKDGRASAPEPISRPIEGTHSTSLRSALQYCSGKERYGQLLNSRTKTGQGHAPSGRSAELFPNGISISSAMPSIPIKVNATSVTRGTILQL
jgi:hypothetical protein